MAGDKQMDAFLTFGDGKANSKRINIDGETEDVFETKWKSCQLSQYTFAFSLDTTPGTETDNKSGDTAFHQPERSPIQITKAVDAASPQIFVALTLGAIFEDVWVWQKKAGGGKPQKGMSASGAYFWKLHMQQCHISKLTWSGSAEDLTETMEIDYQMIDIEYYRQKSDGSLDSKAVTGQWPPEGVNIQALKKKPATEANADEIYNKVVKLLRSKGIKV